MPRRRVVSRTITYTAVTVKCLNHSTLKVEEIKFYFEGSKINKYNAYVSVNKKLSKDYHILSIEKIEYFTEKLKIPINDFINFAQYYKEKEKEKEK